MCGVDELLRIHRFENRQNRFQQKYIFIILLTAGGTPKKKRSKWDGIIFSLGIAIVVVRLDTFPVGCGFELGFMCQNEKYLTFVVNKYVLNKKQFVFSPNYYLEL